ncbi:hypothetical protein IF2G_05310 [Cordyceps javanica]|nr:hypothetical protein IF2G_05310 [Cordyceps javanica]
MHPLYPPAVPANLPRYTSYLSRTSQTWHPDLRLVCFLLFLPSSTSRYTHLRSSTTNLWTTLTPIFTISTPTKSHPWACHLFSTPSRTVLGDPSSGHLSQNIGALPYLTTVSLSPRPCALFSRLVDSSASTSSLKRSAVASLRFPSSSRLTHLVISAILIPGPKAPRCHHSTPPCTYLSRPAPAPTSCKSPICRRLH